MQTLSFEEFWSRNWKTSGQPTVFDAVMREIAAMAWNAAVDSGAASLTKKDSDLRLMAGELTAGELRTAKAILAGCAAGVRALKVEQGQT